MNFTWLATNAPPQQRYDDIWMIAPEVGWAVNSGGQIVHTKDGFEHFDIQQTVEGDVWLRCMSFTSPTDGWVGTITRRQRLWRTQDGKTWTNISSSLPALPIAVCGIHSPSKNVVYASGTQFPEAEAAVMKTTDGGQTWTSISMAAHANLLIDNFFMDDLHGWVVGGKGGTSLDQLKPVVLFTSDGGQTWENRLENSGIDFPSGEWGWKIQFLNAQVGFVSLENDTAAAILKTTDGGRTWRRIEVKDPQKNVELEGVGFVNEMVGWVGGWGHGFQAGRADGTTSGTTDGGATWFDANNVLRFVNRFRFFPGGKPIAGYASGGTVYQCVASESQEDADAMAARFSAAPAGSIPKVWSSMDVKAEVPAKAQRLTVTVFDPRQKLVKVLADEKAPRAGARTFTWDFRDEEGKDSGTGHFIARVLVDSSAGSSMVVRPARAAPEDLGKQVVDMITRIAPIALRAHDELTLPDASGTPVTLKSLLRAPRDLMAALVRGGWVIPEAPDRSMFLTAIIGTGPMRGRMTKADVQLLSDWITAGAVIPAGDA
ncbi:MAG: YCF48-related protein [Xanthobacteraceae bacterium]